MSSFESTKQTMKKDNKNKLVKFEINLILALIFILSKQLR